MAAGEYTLFGVNTAQGSEVFHLQGRLGPRGWPATTTVALAFGVPGVYAYQVNIIILEGPLENPKLLTMSEAWTCGKLGTRYQICIRFIETKDAMKYILSSAYALHDLHPCSCNSYCRLLIGGYNDKCFSLRKRNKRPEGFVDMYKSLRYCIRAISVVPKFFWVHTTPPKIFNS